MSHKWPNPKTNKWKSGKHALYKQQKREEAQARQERYNKLSLVQKIRSIDLRLGKGVGACKERLRLMILQEQEKEAKQKEK